MRRRPTRQARLANGHCPRAWGGYCAGWRRLVAAFGLRAGLLLDLPPRYAMNAYLGGWGLPALNAGFPGSPRQAAGSTDPAGLPGLFRGAPAALGRPVPAASCWVPMRYREGRSRQPPGGTRGLLSLASRRTRGVRRNGPTAALGLIHCTCDAGPLASAARWRLLGTPSPTTSTAAPGQTRDACSPSAGRLANFLPGRGSRRVARDWG